VGHVFLFVLVIFLRSLPDTPYHAISVNQSIGISRVLRKAELKHCAGI
jgi:hypothetical protein